MLQGKLTCLGVAESLCILLKPNWWAVGWILGLLFWAGTGTAQQQTGSSLRVQLVDIATGAPITRASVSVERRPSPEFQSSLPFSVASQPTDLTGNAAFTGLPQGLYWISVAAQRYRLIDERLVQGNTVRVVLRDSSVDVSLRLTPGGGAVLGAVTDSNGSPIANAKVSLLSRDYSQLGEVNLADQGRVQTTDVRGEFTFVGLPTGVYYLKVSFDVFSPLYLTQIPVYYPREVGPETAVPISIGTPNTTVAGLDVRLLPPTGLYEVAGRIISNGYRVDPLTGFYLYAVGAQNSTVLNRANESSGPDSFLLRNVPPGAYDVVVVSNSRSSAWSARARAVVSNVAARTDLTVLPDSPLDIRIQGSAGMPSMDFSTTGIQLLPTSSAFNLYRRLVRFDKEGHVLVTVPQIDYFIQSLVPLARGTYVSAAVLDGRNVLNEVFSVSGPAALRVQLKDDGGTVTGHALTENLGQPFAGRGRAVLVPMLRQGNNPNFSFKTAPLTTQGEFILYSVPPGEYQLFAFEENTLQGVGTGQSLGRYFNDGFLMQFQSRAVHVNVQPHSRVTQDLRIVLEK